jgi:cyclic pyranopterin phosphate synthase
MLSHLDNKGNAKIVDISGKKISSRIAKASGKISISQDVLNQINLKKNKKGDIFTVSKIAGIMAAKKTSGLIPLCHQINLDDILINFELDEEKKYISVTSSIKCKEKTGAEMEALIAASISLLTIYDMCKAIDSNMVIYDIKLIEKSGGKKIKKLIENK